jgi:hypothetical protein
VRQVHLVQGDAVRDDQPGRVMLPEHVQLSLLEIAGSAREGLIALAVGAGLAVLPVAGVMVAGSGISC